MKIINIDYIYKSKIHVFFDNGKDVLISGEWTLTPAFYALPHSIKFWNTEQGEVKITDKERNEIIKLLIEKTEIGIEVPIYF